VIDLLEGDTSGRTILQHWHLAASFDEKQVVLASNRELITTRESGTNLRILRIDTAASEPQLLRGSMTPPGGWVFPVYGKKAPASEVVWESPMDECRALLTWIEPVSGIPSKSRNAPVADAGEIRWSTMSGLPVQLILKEKEGLLRAGSAHELRWKIEPGSKAPLPLIPTQ
jgi:hypothetical protein